MISVLIIDDDPEVQTLLSLMLNSEGYLARRAGSGKEAIEAYRKEPSDVVVTDLRMPEMDGIQVIHELKKIDERVAVVVLTAHGDLESAVKMMQSDGVYNYLTKPLDAPEVLIAAIQSALEKRRLSLENQQLIARLQAANDALEVRVNDRTGALMASNSQLSLELRRRQRIEQALEHQRADLEHRIETRTRKLAQINRLLNMEVVERRRSEDALRRSELKAQIESQELELIYRSAPVGLCLLDEEHKFIKANPTMTDITGMSLEDHISQPLERVSPRLAKALSPVIRRITSTGKPIPSHVVSLPGVSNKSQLRHWLVSSYPLILDGEEKTATSHIFQDISEQRQAQEYIRQSKTMLQAVFDGIQDPLIMVDRKMVVRMINRAAKDYYKIENYKDFLGKKCGDVIPNQEFCATCRIPELVANGHSGSFERASCYGETMLERVAVYALCQSASGLDGAIIQLSDITGTKNLERQLFHSEKLASLGFLASGVAHEINNPNGFITFNLPILRNYISAVMSQVSPSDQPKESRTWFGMSFDAFYKDLFQLIDNLEHGAQRISKIVASMNSLAQPKVMGSGLRRCHFAHILDQVETLCSGELKRLGQRLIVNCPSDLPELMIDTDALEQVLINLLMNAAQAGDKSEAWIRVTVDPPKDGRLVFVVQDNGCGMDDTVREKIFDPFFTTKAPGSGTGLGLAICHNLVTSMGGTIQIESVPGEGSTFRINLPVRYADATDRDDNAALSRLDGMAPGRSVERDDHLRSTG